MASRIPDSYRRADPATAQAMAQFASQQRERGQQFGRAQVEGDYLKLVELRAGDFIQEFPPFFINFGELNILTIFLLGVYAVRRGVLTGVQSHIPFLRRVMWWGLVVGLVSTAGFTYGAVALGNLSAITVKNVLLGLMMRTLRLAGGMSLALFYASGIVLLTQRRAWQKILAPIAWAGRIGFTNYVLQSVFMTFIFYGYGLGLEDKVGTLTGFGLTVGIFLTHMALGLILLKRLRFGPMEWLWRSLTYGKLQPMRLRGKSAAAAKAG